LVLVVQLGPSVALYIAINASISDCGTCENDEVVKRKKARIKRVNRVFIIVV